MAEYATKLSQLINLCVQLYTAKKEFKPLFQDILATLEAYEPLVADLKNPDFHMPPMALLLLDQDLNAGLKLVRKIKKATGIFGWPLRIFVYSPSMKALEKRFDKDLRILQGHDLRISAHTYSLVKKMYLSSAAAADDVPGRMIVSARIDPLSGMRRAGMVSAPSGGAEIVSDGTDMVSAFSSGGDEIVPAQMPPLFRPHPPPAAEAMSAEAKYVKRLVMILVSLYQKHPHRLSRMRDLVAMAQIYLPAILTLTPSHLSSSICEDLRRSVELAQRISAGSAILLPVFLLKDITELDASMERNIGLLKTYAQKGETQSCQQEGRSFAITS